MKNELHFRVVDKGGLFLPVAIRLARESEVSYWSSHERDFDTVTDRIGEGFPGIHRAESWLDDKRGVDCFVFPDVGMISEQLDLQEQGFLVFGSGAAGMLEQERGLFLDTLEEAGLPVPPHERIKGISKLREYLRDKEDLYVKISRYRREGETFHWRSWDEDRDVLAEKEVSLGPFAERITFYVFEPIKAIVEDGLDTFAIGGAHPELAIHGVESKDKAFLCTWQRWGEIPEELTRVNEALAPMLADADYRGPLSTEVRITPERQSLFIDITTRFGSPPHQCQGEMIDNYAETLLAIAGGEVPRIEPAHQFAIQAVVNTGRCADSWCYLKADEELLRWLKCSKAMFFDGMVCCPPDPKFTGCEDWLLGVGDSIEEAVAHLQENCDLLPDGCDCNLECVADLIKKINESEEHDLKFTDQQVPEPEIVLEDE